MYSKTFFPLLLLLVVNSCSIQGDFKGLYSYYEATKKESSNLLVPTDSNTQLCSLQPTAEPKVYITNGRQLKECLKDYENAVVFIWAPKCSGAACYNLTALQRFCDANGIELFVMAEYYDSKEMLSPFVLEHPIFAPDIDYYHTSITSKYIQKLVAELGVSDGYTNRLLCFNKGTYVKSVVWVKDI